MAWLVGHGVWRGRNIGRSGTKRHVGNPVVVSKKCEYLGIACYPLPESICYGRGTKHSCGQSHPVSSCQPTPVISHSGTEMLPLNGVAMGPRLHGSSIVWAPLLPSNVTVDYPTWQQRRQCVRASLRSFGTVDCPPFRSFVRQLTSCW